MLVDVRGGWGPALQQAIRTFTDRPITTVVNTHSHPGHVTGNIEMPAGLQIISHVNAQEQMAHMPVFVQSGGRGLPTRTFTDRLVIGAGEDRIELEYFGRGHTDGDIWVVFPAARVAYVDIFPGKEMPLLDDERGGSGVEIVETLARASASLAGRVDRIVTAHGPAVLAISDLEQYVSFNRDFLELVGTGKRAGRSMDEIAAGWKMPEKYAGYAKPAPERVRANVEVVFNEVR